MNMLELVMSATAHVAALVGAPPAAHDAERQKVFERTEGWIAADGASTVDLHDGRVLWLFGDTLVGGIKAGGGSTEGTKMVNNTIGVQKLGAAEMDFQWGDVTGKVPTSWAAPAGVNQEKPSRWLWPAGGGIRIKDGVNDRLVLFFMMMRRREESNSVWNFQQHGAAVVTVENPSAAPAEWRRSVGTLRDHAAALDAKEKVKLVSWGPAVIDDPESADHVLVYGVDVSVTLDKRLMLARAPRGTVEKFETWEFRTKDGWSAQENEAASIARGAVDEFSVNRVSIGGRERYVLMQMEPNMGVRLLVRFAERPEGPWTDGREVFAAPEPKQDKRLMVYSGKLHPELKDADGSMVATYCVNSTDFWHMLGSPALYRPRFVRVPMWVLEEAGK